MVGGRLEGGGERLEGGMLEGGWREIVGER